MSSLFLGENSTFSFQGHNVLVIKRGGRALLSGIEVCKALGFKRPGDALLSHVEDEDKQVVDLGGQAGKVVFITKPGCYDLAIASPTEVGKAFRRWLSHDVVPDIERDGGYISPTITPEQIEVLRSRINRLEQENGLLEARVQYLDNAKSETIEKFRQDINAYTLKPKMQCSADDFDMRVSEILHGMGEEGVTIEGYKYGRSDLKKHFPLTPLIRASRSCIKELSPKSLKSFDETFNEMLGY